MKRQTRSIWKGWAILGIAAGGLLFIAAGAFLNSVGHASETAGLGNAPAWTLKDVKGHQVSLNQFKGKVVILDFWATWCGPCRLEIPGFIKLQKKYKKDGLEVVGVSLDDGPGVVKKFIKSHHLNYTVVMGNQQIARDYGNIEAIPTTFVIDRKGRIVGKHVGVTDLSTFEKQIKPLLKAKPENS